MPYDEDLVNRLREVLAPQDAVTERKMFGGFAFLLNGHLTVGASRSGGLLARIDPAGTEAALALPHTALMNMGGRALEGWIIVAPEGVASMAGLRAWVKRSIGYVETLPPK